MKDFKIGDKIKLAVNVGPSRKIDPLYGVEKGDVLVCVHDLEPLKGYLLGNGKVNCEWANNHKDYFEEKAMKREDKVNIEITLQEAAWLYAISAKANGTVGWYVYKTLKDFVDPKCEAYVKCINGKFDLIDYRSVQPEFEAAIFDRKSPEQLQLAEVMSKISDLQAEAVKLQALVNK